MPKQFNRLLVLFSIFFIIKIFSPNDLYGQLRGDQVAENFINNVVHVRVEFSGTQEKSGFGFVVGEEEHTLYAVTAKHLLRSDGVGENLKKVDVFFNFNHGIPFTATIERAIYTEPIDLAVLSIPKPDKFSLEISCTQSTFRRGDEVWFIGRENAWYIPTQSGRISGPADESQPSDKIIAELDRVQPGTSGAPLFSEEGIIGMIVRDDADKKEVEAINIVKIRQCIQAWGYPWGLREFSDAEIYNCGLSEDIAMITVDGDYYGISSQQRHAWRRGWANLIRMLSGAGAKVIAFDINLIGGSEYDEYLREAVESSMEQQTGIYFVKDEADIQKELLQVDNDSQRRFGFGFACRGRNAVNGNRTKRIFQIPILLQRNSNGFWSKEESLIFKAADRYYQAMNRGWLNFQNAGDHSSIFIESVEPELGHLSDFELLPHRISRRPGCDFIRNGDIVYNLQVSLAPIELLKQNTDRYFYYSLERNQLYNAVYDTQPNERQLTNLFSNKIVVIGINAEEDILEDGINFGVDSLAAAINALLKCGGEPTQ